MTDFNTIVNIRISVSQREAINEYCKKSGSNISEVIRGLIDMMIKEPHLMDAAVKVDRDQRVLTDEMIIAQLYPLVNCSNKVDMVEQLAKILKVPESRIWHCYGRMLLAHGWKG